MSLNGRKRIVILGGGCGGIVAATKLGRALGAEHEVILVDRRPDHIFMPAFLFLMCGERWPPSTAVGFLSAFLWVLIAVHRRPTKLNGCSTPISGSAASGTA